jgi:hypothetical protein
MLVNDVWVFGENAKGESPDLLRAGRREAEARVSLILERLF